MAGLVLVERQEVSNERQRESLHGLAGQRALDGIGSIGDTPHQHILWCGIAERVQPLGDVLGALVPREHAAIRRPFEDETVTCRIGEGKCALFAPRIAVEQDERCGMTLVDLVKEVAGRSHST